VSCNASISSGATRISKRFGGTALHCASCQCKVYVETVRVMIFRGPVAYLVFEKSQMKMIMRMTMKPESDE
jgi:hypothetical protein